MSYRIMRILFSLLYSYIDRLYRASWQNGYKLYILFIPGADQRKNDGIYSSYFTEFRGGGRYNLMVCSNYFMRCFLNCVKGRCQLPVCLFVCLSVSFCLAPSRILTHFLSLSYIPFLYIWFFHYIVQSLHGWRHCPNQKRKGRINSQV